MKTALTLVIFLPLTLSFTFSIFPSSPKPKTKKEIQLGATPFSSMPTKMTKKTCSKVDLAPKLGPVHNQTAGTCYAYAALDLLNYGTDTRYSALHLATLKKFIPPDPNKKSLNCSGEPQTTLPKRDVFDDVGGLSGGLVDTASKLGLVMGLCPESLVPSSDGVLKKDYRKLLEYYAEKTSDSEYCEIDPQLITLNPELIKALNSSVKNKFSTDDVKNEIQRMYPALTLEIVNAIADSSKSADELIKRLNQSSCEGNLVKGIPPGKTPANVSTLYNRYQDGCVKFYYEEDRLPLLDKINKALDEGRPVSVSYVTGGLIQPPKTKTHGYHASVLGGRSWLEEIKEDGKVIQEAGCYYQIKNSWGPDWKVPEGVKARTSSNYPGYFVVSEKQLMEHIYGATTID